jgi:class 3 adenylate cyclase
MPLYMDRHTLVGVTSADIAAAHVLDTNVQDQYGVNYVTYWFDEASGKAFCLAEGPSKQAVEDVHRNAHGLLAEQIIEVDGEMVKAFMGALETHALGEAYEATGFRAILFTDVVDSTALTQKLGDAVARRLMRELEADVDRAIVSAGGTRVKQLGDGVMGSFVTAGAAVNAAMAICDASNTFNAEHEERLQLRTGIAAGEPVTEDGDLFGTAVQMAARLCSQAAPGEILVSAVVRELCRGRALTFESRGPVELKGFAEPVEVYTVSVP